MRKKKKGVVWYSDFVVGFTMFLVGILLATNYIRNNFVITREGVNDLTFAANTLSETLMRQGVPDNWNETNVFQIGLTDGNYNLNITKLQSLDNLSQDNYETSKRLVGSSFDYLIYFKNSEDVTQSFTSSTYIGYPGYNETNVFELANDIITISRYVVMKEESGGETSASIIKMIVHVWQNE